MTYELLSRHEVERRVDLTTTSIYRLMRSGQFPRPIRIGAQAVRWRSDELERWLDTRPRAGGETVPDTQGPAYATA